MRFTHGTALWCEPASEHGVMRVCQQRHIVRTQVLQKRPRVLAPGTKPPTTRGKRPSYTTSGRSATYVTRKMRRSRADTRNAVAAGVDVQNPHGPPMPLRVRWLSDVTPTATDPLHGR